MFGDLYGVIGSDGTWWPKEGGEEAKAAIMGELDKHDKKPKSFVKGK